MSVAEIHRIPISQPFLDEEEKRAVIEVLDSGMLVQGPQVARLEDRFRALTGAKHAIATSSGTTALHLALLAHGVGPGDEVITSPFTFIASVNAILYVGATPVFADVDLGTFNIVPEMIRSAVSGRTKVIMPVHLYGQPADMDAIVDIAREHQLAIIEDAAQAVGATYKGRRVGSYGTGCFSLYATKNVMSAEGGMVTTSDDKVAERVRLLRQHGMRQRYRYEMLGYNFRLSDLHAAIGNAQMERLAHLTAARRRNADFLNNNIKQAVTPTVVEPGHVWHQYTIRVPAGVDRDGAVARLEAAGIGTGIFYPTPAHREEYVRERIGELRMPNAERLSTEVISLPVHPKLSIEDLSRIAAAVNRLV